MFRRLADVVAIAVAIVVVGVCGLTGCGGGGGSAGVAAERAAQGRADQVRAAAGQAGLPASVQTFMADAVGSAGRTYTVTYDLGEHTATVVQRPPSRRLDVVGTGGETQAYIANRKGTYSCQRPAGGSWSCQADSQSPPAAGALSLDDVAAGITSLTASAAAYSMQVEPRRLAGVDGRCLIAIPKTGGGQPQTLCISPAGVPLLIELGSGSGVVRATRYRASASSGAFTLPAPARSG